MAVLSHFLLLPCSLLLYGVVCTLQEKHEAAETFFEAATCVQPRSILAWTMLGRSTFILSQTMSYNVLAIYFDYQEKNLFARY